MKKIYLMAIAAAFTFGMTSCEDFLDSENYTEANTANYPASPGDLNKELAALYGVMNQFSTDPLQSPWFVPYLMSDGYTRLRESFGPRSLDVVLSSYFKHARAHDTGYGCKRIERESRSRKYRVLESFVKSLRNSPRRT